MLCFQPSAVRPSLIPEKSEPPPGPLWNLRPCGGQLSHYAHPPRMRPSDATPSHPPNLERLPQKLEVTAGRRPSQSQVSRFVLRSQTPTSNTRMGHRQSASTWRPSLAFIGWGAFFSQPQLGCNGFLRGHRVPCSPIVCKHKGGGGGHASQGARCGCSKLSCACVPDVPLSADGGSLSRSRHRVNASP